MNLTAKVPFIIGTILSQFAQAAELGGVGAQSRELKPFERSAEHSPQNTPEAAQKNLAKATIPEGFTATIWAAEPLLANPVAFCFDDRGRMFVSETHRYRSSVLDIRHYMFMLEDDLANRNQADWTASIKRNFPKDWQELGRESELIRLLEDSNADGKADNSTVFAGGFNSILDGIASGVLAYKNNVYFTNIPSLWRLNSPGPDGKSTHRDELIRGFGVRFSYTGHDFHGLAIGPDMRLYFSIGDRGASIAGKSAHALEYPDEGAVYRCELDGSHLEIVMRGLRNPQELAFDDLGNLFTGDNDSDQGDRERLVAVVPGADAGWRIGWQHHPLGKEFNSWLTQAMWEPRANGKLQPEYILSPIANLPDGPSGLVHYPGTGLPDAYAGSFFLAGYKGSTAKSLVSTFKVESDGAGFRLANLSTFMDHVQATDVDFGPDSRLYVSAWDEGWERTDQGRIYRLENTEAVKTQSAQIAAVQRLLADGFESIPPLDLLKLLAHADQRIRLRAQWALTDLVTSNNKEVDSGFLKSITDIIQNGADGPARRLSRLHAMWLTGSATRISGLRFMEKLLNASPNVVAHDSTISLPDYFSGLYKDKDPEVRAQFARVLADVGQNPGPETLKNIATLLDDSQLRVCFFAALALGQYPHEHVKPVLDLVRRNNGRDRYIQHAAVRALSSVTDIKALREFEKDTDRNVRIAVLLAERNKGLKEIAGFLADPDPSIAREAAIAINDVPIVGAMADLAKLALAKVTDRPLALRILNASFRIGGSDEAARITRFAAEPGNDPGLRGVALTMLAMWNTPPTRDFVTGTYRPLPPSQRHDASDALAKAAPSLLRDHSQAVVLASIQAIRNIGSQPSSNSESSNGKSRTVFADELLGMVKNETSAGRVRAAAFDALFAIDPNLPQSKAAAAAALSGRNAELNVSFSKQLGSAQPDRAAANLASSWKNADPNTKRMIATVLGQLPSQAANDALANAIDGLDQEPPEARLEILEAARNRVKAASDSRLQKSLEKYAKRAAAEGPLGPFKVALEGGDRDRGESLFKEHAVAACLRCHQVNHVGGEAGPSLDGYGSKHTRNDVIESIVTPNAKIADGFQMVVLTLNDGNILAGTLKKETDSELIIQNPGEPSKNIRKTDIKQRDNAPSGMLPNLADLLTLRELRDLVEYVSSLK